MKTSLPSAIALSPFLLSLSPAVGFAQTSVAQSETTTQPTTTTLCRYDPNSGVPNVFGMRTYITLTESDGNTNFLLEQFPAFVSNPENVEQRADVSETRSLTLYDIPIAEARQLMINQPYFYAALLDTDVAEVETGLGFEAVDATLGCGQVTAETPAPEEPPAEIPEPSPETPTTETPPAATPPQTLAELPNGNYRFAAAELPNRVVTDEELLEAGGALFLFRKFGDSVTGNFSFIDSEGGSCITGVVDRNTVVGDAYAFSETVRAGTFLDLGTETEAGKYEGSVLNLEGFSRINAGTRLPVESCS
ncbi:MAG: hypothetical protein AAFR25_01315 [Cyanobacteria bacterium J06629_19]